MKQVLNTIKKHDTVALVGFASNTRDLVPRDRPLDIWSLNERYKHGELDMTRVTCWFQMHPYWNCMREGNRNDPDHPKWLREKHPFPIFMQKEYSDIPSSVRYPLEEVIKFMGVTEYESSFAYMIALACLAGYKRIEIYGFEMASGTEYFHQRSNAKLMIGIAIGKGIEVYIPNESKMAFNNTLYGYQSIRTGFRQQIEFRYNSTLNQEKEAVDQFNIMKGKYLAVKDILEGKLEANEATLKALQDEAHKQGNLVNTLGGARQAFYQVLEVYDDYVGEGDVQAATEERYTT